MVVQSVEEYDSKIIGINEYEVIVGFDVVVIIVGLFCRFGMSWDDLLGKNVNIVVQGVWEVLCYFFNVILIVVINFLDVMIYLVWKVIGLFF